ncbi:MAG: acyl-CoA dehydrogenase family protein, partial [Acidimicrobiales bacterium]
MPAPPAPDAGAGDRREPAAYLAGASTPAAVRRAMATATGHDPAIWGGLAGRGGLPPGAVDGPVVEALGATLACVPFLSTVVLAGTALVAAGDTAHLAALAAGRRTATVALDADVVARAGPRGTVLDGAATSVVDGHTAAVVVVAAARSDGGGEGLYVVEGEEAGLTRTPLVTMDPTRRQARLDLHAVPARCLAAGDEARRARHRVLDAAAVALAAEAVGGAGRCLDLAVVHAGRRVQFGRPVGSFQAVQHRLADALVALESARAASEAATAALAATSVVAVGRAGGG